MLLQTIYSMTGGGSPQC
jgi:primosomal replication protein N